MDRLPVRSNPPTVQSDGLPARNNSLVTKPRSYTGLVAGLVLIIFVAIVARIVSARATFLPEVVFALMLGLAIRNLALREQPIAARFTVHYVLRVAIILLVERKLNLRWGRAFAVYLIWYGLGRSWLEAIRIDPTSDGFLGIPANVWASFVAIALGITLFIIQTRRHPEPEPSVIRDGWVPRAPRGASPTETVESSAAKETVEPTPRR
jgi:hypothetical protein